MNSEPLVFRTLSSRHVRVGMVLLLAMAGCRRESIQVYTAPRDEPPPPPATHSHPAMPERPSRPQLSWKTPAGWKETGPGKMSQASFAINGANGEEASVSITQLARLAGREELIINMWRAEIGLPEITSEEAAKSLQPVDVGGEKGLLFEVTGADKRDGTPASIVTAMVHRPEGTWFYKLSGSPALVQAQKPVFVEFLKSIQLKAPGSTETESPVESSGFKWKVPSQWTVLPAGQMQVAKFAVPERSGAKAEVFVSAFPNDTGGTLANVNRWRRQLQLAEVGENELASLVSPLDSASSGSILVELANNQQQLVGAIVPRGGTFWFYKLLGDAGAVAPERETFITFAKSKP